MDVIGREPQLDELSARLAAHRLVTIMGPGGIGKTALARAAAVRNEHRFPLGVRTVDLTRVDGPDEVGTTVAQQLGFPSFGALLGSPTDRPALVVVDNCEHVLDAAATCVADLLAACASPTVIATSRSPLDLPGESVLVLGPLESDGHHDGDGEHDLAPAVRLFLQRARDASVEIAPDQLPQVVALCRALDGLPLAVEIAAARTRVMQPAEMLALLDDLDILSRPRFRGDARHRSLRATVEWSYRHLEPEDQRFFDQLSVISGPFSVEDAQAVADPPMTAPETIHRIESLLHASMLVSEPEGPATRYRQLGTVRTFAREQLVASGGWDTTWDRFVGHVASWPVALMREAAARWDDSVLHDLLVRFDTCARVLRWCTEHDDEPDRALGLVSALWGVVHQAHVEEVAGLAEAALTRWPDPATAGWADAAATAATCRYLLGAPESAIELAQRALRHADASTFAPCTLRRVVAQSLAALGDISGAMSALDEAITVAEGRVPTLAWEMVVFRAELAANVGEIEAGLARVREVEVASLEARSGLNAVWAATVAATLLLRSDRRAAADAAQHALRRSRELDYPACERVNVHTLAEIAILDDDLDAAASHLDELLSLLVERGALSEVRNAIRTTAVLLERRGRPRWAELAATIPTLPVVSVFNVPGYERLPLPPSSGPGWTPAQAVAVAREELRLTPAAIPAPSGDGSPRARRFERRGDVWELEWDGTAVSVRSTKGMEDLARLLSEPGVEVHCLDLAQALAEEPSTGAVIDGTARREYEQRIRDLHDEIEEAEALHDIVRAERAQAELDTLVDHLTAALSRVGRARGSGGSVERARSAVTQRVRAAIRRIDELHPPLGRHLSISVRTGTYCSYRPESPVDWSVG